MRRYDIIELIIIPFEWIIDLINYIKADEETRNYIDNVPRFCRKECGKELECRNPKNNWKCYNGCLYLDSKSKKKKNKVKYHENGLPLETRYNEEDYKYYR